MRPHPAQAQRRQLHRGDAAGLCRCRNTPGGHWTQPKNQHPMVRRTTTVRQQQCHEPRSSHCRRRAEPKVYHHSCCVARRTCSCGGDVACGFVGYQTVAWQEAPPAAFGRCIPSGPSRLFLLFPPPLRCSRRPGALDISQLPTTHPSPWWPSVRRRRRPFACLPSPFRASHRERRLAGTVALPHATRQNTGARTRVNVRRGTGAHIHAHPSRADRRSGCTRSARRGR